MESYDMSSKELHEEIKRDFNDYEIFIEIIRYVEWDDCEDFDVTHYIEHDIEFLKVNKFNFGTYRKCYNGYYPEKYTGLWLWTDNDYFLVEYENCKLFKRNKKSYNRINKLNELGI